MSGKDDRARVEQIIGECFVKAANIILSSRFYQDSRTISSPQAPQRCWFNLEVDEVQSAQEEVQQWRRDTSAPLVLEIYQQPWGPDESGIQARTASVSQASSSGSSHLAGSNTLLERWTIHWQQEKRSAKLHSSRLEPAAIYKRLMFLQLAFGTQVITLRSLFTYVRVLPAFKMYKDCKQNRSSLYSLQYRLSRGPAKEAVGPALPPGSPGRMQQFHFSAIETPYGSLKINVEYQPSTAVRVLEQAVPPVASASPHIFPDYVGSQRGGGGTATASGGTAAMHSTLSASLSSSGRDSQLPDPSSSPPGPPGVPGIGKLPAQQASPILRRHSWSLNTARSLGQEKQCSPELQPSAAPRHSGAQHSGAQQLQPGTPSRSSSMGAQSPYAFPSLPQVQTRMSSRGGQPSAFAPNTPNAAATPPKYPSGGLASRVSQAAAQAASKLYSGQGRGGSPSARGGTPSGRGASLSPAGSGRASPARRSRSAVAEEMRTFKSVGATPPVPEENPVEEAEPPAGSLGARLASKPVRIPGCDKDSRRMHSSEDLRSLVYEGLPRPNARKSSGSKTTAASAPAAPTYFGFSPENPPGPAGHRPSHKPSPTPFARVSKAAGSEKPAQPSTPPVMQTLPSLGSESSGSVTSFPASCSPQLPFAFTPSSHSFTEPQRQDLGFRAGTPPNVDVGVLAVARPPSWGGRSSSFEVSSGMGPNIVGYSVSPMLDSLESSLFMSSTPKHGHQLPFSLPSQASSPLTQHGTSSQSDETGAPPNSSTGSTSTYGPLRLTFPLDATLLASDETEPDSLPFALDRESSLVSPSPAALHGGGAPAGGSETEPTSLGMEAEPDAAVGAFVRLIQEAPPLHRSDHSRSAGGPAGRLSSAAAQATEMSLQAGLDQLSRIRMQLSTMQPQLNPMPSEASEVQMRQAQG